MRYFVRLVLEDNQVAFEELSEIVFKDRKFALNQEGNPRYHDNYVIFDGNVIKEMILNDVPAAMTILGLCRALSISPNHSTLANPQGFIRETGIIPFKKGNSKFIISTVDGAKYKRA